MKKILIALAVLGAVLTGCGGDDKKDRIAYRPVAFGDNQQCYYVHSPEEVLELQREGLCDVNWVPVQMPQQHYATYYPYYSSPLYYNAFVPMATRTVYIERARSWGESNRTTINAAAKTAKYQGSDGKVVDAKKVGAAKYGSGTRFGPAGTKFGGGTRTQTQATTPAPDSTKTTTAVTSKATPATSKPATPKVSPPKTKASPQPKSSPAPRPSGGSKSYGGGSRGGRR